MTTSPSPIYSHWSPAPPITKTQRDALWHLETGDNKAEADLPRPPPNLPGGLDFVIVIGNDQLPSAFLRIAVLEEFHAGGLDSRLPLKIAAVSGARLQFAALGNVRATS